MKVLTCEQMRTADNYTINSRGVASLTLMEKAGERVALVAEKALFGLKNKKVLVVCGSGNNGGDGYVAARILSQKGYYVSVFSVFEPKSDDCVKTSRTFTGEVYSELGFENSFGLIIDCIYGTGFHDAINQTARAAVDFINNSDAYVISVDIPSGLNGDNGKGDCYVCADCTVAIGELKYGHVLNDGKDACGRVCVEDIGIIVEGDNYAEIYSKDELALCFAKRKSNSHKGDYGRVSVIGGSEIYSGAPLMGVGALKAGCGYLQICVPDCIFPCLIGKFPEVILKKMPSKKGALKYDKKCLDDIIKTSDSIAIGMGCTTSVEIYKIVKHLLKSFKGTLIIDADALNSVAKFGLSVLKNKKCKVIITPHVKEFCRLTKKNSDEITASSVKTAKEFATKYKVNVMLKSNTVIITDGDKVVLSSDGTPALAKGGSGDVLAGLVAALSARISDKILVCACAMYILGKSAETLSKTLSEYGVCASDLILQIPKTINELISI